VNAAVDEFLAEGAGARGVNAPATQEADPGRVLAAAVNAHREGRLEEARHVYEALLAARPQDAGVLHWLATLHLQAGRLSLALHLYEQCVGVQPEHAEAHSNRGNTLRCMRRPLEAVEAFDRALKLRPDYAEAWSNRGIALQDLERWEDAVRCYDHALELKPDYTNAWKNRGVALREMGRLEEALRCHDRAVELQPEDATAHNYRGNALHRLRRLEEAVESYDRAVTLRPGYAEAWYNRSISLRELKRIDDAIDSCGRAIALQPEHADAHWNKAELLILKGDYQQGWPLFEWRWKSMRYSMADRNFDTRIWLGAEGFAGKTVLINPDGGFGDTLHFCRYAPLLAERGARVILEVQPGLVTLLRESFPALEIIANGQPLPAFDCYCPMMSLPAAMATPLNEVPASLPYLHIPPAHCARWAGLLGHSRRPRIGLVWSGSPEHSNDQQRSMAATLLEPLLTLDAEFHCLQKVIRDTDRAALSAGRIKTWETELEDFADTAALTAEMDLVISVDTSVAHLAGALGKPVWVLLPYVPDMRWLAEGSHSHWYPSKMRLFGQDASRQWPQVVARVLEELRLRFGEPAPAC